MPPKRIRELVGSVDVQQTFPISSSPSLITVTQQRRPVDTLDKYLRPLLSADGSNLLTSDQISKLDELRLSSGAKMFTLDKSGKAFIYQMALQIPSFGFDLIYSYLSETPWDNIKDIYLNSPALEPSRYKFNLDLDLSLRKIKIAKGLYRCGRCGSNEILTASSQTRSADEPMTIFAKCIHCQNQWTE